MVDVVVNHFGSSDEVDYSSYTPFNDGSYFHSEDFITDYNNQTLVEQGWLGDSQVPLPDVNTENGTVVSTYTEWISNLVQTYQIDGLRLDTVKHVRQNFWPGFISAADVFSLGEVLSGDPTYLSSYQPYTGGLLDYGTYYPLLRAFLPGGNMNEIASLTAPSYRALFTDTQLLGCFMENHDNPRFTNSTSSDLTIVKSAMAYVMLSDGIPIIYYGQEQSFSGGQDPANREYLWMSDYAITPLYSYLAVLNRARSLAWSAGFGTNLSSVVYLDTNVMVTQKGPLLMVLSNQGSLAANKTVSFPTQFAAGTVLVDVLTCHAVSIGKSSTSITVASGTPQIYLTLGLASQMCTNIALPSFTSTSIIARITSIFTSSSKVATKTTAKSSLSTYDSGTAATTTTNLGIAKPSISSTAPSLQTSTTLQGRVPLTTATRSSTTSTTSTPVGRLPLTRATSSSTSTSTSTPGRMPLTVATPTSQTSRPVTPISPSTSTFVSSTSSKAGRVPLVVASSPTAAKQKRHLHDQARLVKAESNMQSRPISPYGPQPQRKLVPMRQATAPPASLSQHYRTERVLAPTTMAGLSSKYSYSSSHLPPSGKIFSEGHRSSSETNLHRRLDTGGQFSGHAPSRSFHSLQHRNSSTSLKSQWSRGNADPLPPMPPKLDSRSALFDDGAPYAHTLNLSSTSLALPSPRSRRSSITSLRSTKHSSDRQRSVSQERLQLLSQENGESLPYLKPGFVDTHSMQVRANQIMNDRTHSHSRSHLAAPHPRSLSRHGQRSPRLDNSPSLPNIRPRQDNRAQLQQDLRQYPV